jgi:uncharacterized protein (TIGR04255 family)
MEPYRNPPIREALVDIKIEPLTVSYLKTLDGLHDQLRDRYPIKKTRHRWVGSVETQEDRLISAAQKYLGSDGFMFISADEQRILQLRLDGFTLNYLRPYPAEGWPVVREEADRMWTLFAEAVSPTTTIRIGLRYINEINVPMPQIDLDEYLTAAPRIPIDLPQTLDRYLTQVVIPYPNLEAKAIITQSTGNPSDPNSTSIILDIDVFTDVPRKADSRLVWDILDQFRGIKNKIFKSSLHPKTEELFK